MSDYWPEPDLPLFRQMAPAQQHSRTSMAAADSLDEDALNRLQRQVLAVIAAASAGLTDEEIQLHTGMNPSTQRPRRIELERRGFIHAGRDQEDEQRAECCGLEGCVMRPKHLTHVAGYLHLGTKNKCLNAFLPRWLKAILLALP
jgi:hypothetical protein